MVGLGWYGLWVIYFLKGCLMIYTILVALDADPLPPLASSHRYVTRLPLCGVPAFHPVALSWGLLMCEGSISSRSARWIQCHHSSINECHNSVVNGRSNWMPWGSCLRVSWSVDCIVSRNLAENWVVDVQGFTTIFTYLEIKACLDLESMLYCLYRKQISKAKLSTNITNQLHKKPWITKSNHSTTSNKA
jgi:hypothetical protein